jgi:hypothetical protein
MYGGIFQFEVNDILGRCDSKRIEITERGEMTIRSRGCCNITFNPNETREFINRLFESGIITIDFNPNRRRLMPREEKDHDY